LRTALEKQDVNKLSLEEKCGIIEAYMAHDGASGLQFEVDGEDDDSVEVNPQVIEE